MTLTKGVRKRARHDDGSLANGGEQVCGAEPQALANQRTGPDARVAPVRTKGDIAAEQTAAGLDAGNTGAAPDEKRVPGLTTITCFRRIDSCSRLCTRVVRHGHKWRPFVEVSSAADTHPAAAAAAASRRTELPESAGDLVTRTYTISTNAQVELTNVRSDEQASPTKRHSVFVREGAPQLDAPRMTFRAPLAARDMLNRHIVWWRRRRARDHLETVARRQGGGSAPTAPGARRFPIEKHAACEEPASSPPGRSDARLPIGSDPCFGDAERPMGEDGVAPPSSTYSPVASSYLTLATWTTS